MTPVESKAATDDIVTDERELLSRLIPLAGARVVELGCGKAELARRLAERGDVASVTALEVDAIQHARNVASPHPPALRFLAGGADAIPLPAECCEIVVMLKSLHHVPTQRLDLALREVRRVLVPGGLAYISEPVFAGDFNEVVRLFHDEEVVRAAALAAVRRAVASGLFEEVAEVAFQAPIAFRDFDDFVERVVRVTYAERTLEGPLLEEVRSRFERFMTPQGARFSRPMRVNLLRRRP